MSDTNTPDMNKAIFMELVLMLSSSVMQQLGKIINPMTGKTELNLEAAQSTISLLEMIEVKTKGNLDRDEERLIKNTLTSLKMNYVETASSAPAQAEKPGEPATEAKPDEPKDAKEPKFHKTYP